jgi:hypothetical protein
VGTSKAYDAPPAWSDLKGAVTREANQGTLKPETARELLRSFIEHNGGAREIARGTGATGGKARVARGSSAKAIGGRLGGFLADVAEAGLDEGLRRAGWADLIGRPVPELLASLLDRLGGSANTLDDVDARTALSRLQEKYLGGATTAAEVTERLAAQVERIDLFLQDFFGFYLYEVFCRVFFERLVQRVGDTRANSFLEQIADFINSTLANRTGGDLAAIDWGSAQASELIRDIMETTLKVFGG